MTAREFVIEWQRCPSLSQFCSRTGMKPNNACNKAKRFRDHGVPLKYFSNDMVKHKEDSEAWLELAKLAHTEKP